MKEINDLIVITEGYPNPENPYRYTFVEQLVQQFSKKGVRVTVINPVFHNYRQYQHRGHWTYDVAGGNSITVFQPVVINFSMKKIGPLKMMNLSYLSFRRAVEKVIRNNHLQPDAIYSHFLFPSGCAAAEIGKKYRVPAFCATGESNLSEIIHNIGSGFFKAKLNSMQGIISVSSENKRILTDNHIFEKRSIIVIPNGVDQNLFYPHDKTEMRDKYGFPNDQVLGAFVGAFSDRKGILRVNAASDKTSIPMIYIGTGNLQPKGNNIAFCGGVQHHLIPEYLSAADFFVLPTKTEGCCNAIVEAICCGLPIISSHGEFNDDILDDAYSIRIDPENIDQIADAMKKLAEDQTLCKKLSDNAVQQREKFSLSNRAERILKFISEVADDKSNCIA